MPVTRTRIESIRRRDLIEAAYQTFLEHGLNGMTMARISKRSGLSQGVVNYYFKSKDELIFAVAVKVYSITVADTSRGLKLAKSPRDRVNVIIEANINNRIFTTDGARAWVEFFAALWQKPDLARLQYMFDRRIISNLVDSLSKLVSPEDAREIAHTIVFLIDGLWVRKASGIGDLEPKEAVQRIWQIIDLKLADLSRSRNDNV